MIFLAFLHLVLSRQSLYLTQGTRKNSNNNNNTSNSKEEKGELTAAMSLAAAGVARRRPSPLVVMVVALLCSTQLVSAAEDCKFDAKGFTYDLSALRGDAK